MDNLILDIIYRFFVDGEFNGATFTGIPQSEANKTILHSIMKIVGCIIFCGVIAVIIALILVQKMVKGIRGLENTIGTLLDNNLATKHNKYSFEHDEIEGLNNKTVDFAEHLNQIITKIKNASNILKEIALDLKRSTEITNQTSNEIAKAVEEIAHGAINQAESTTDATHKISDMSEGLSIINNDVKDLHNTTMSMNKNKNNLMNTLSDLLKINNVMTNDINDTSQKVYVTNNNVDKIQSVADVITDIASQTNLLSLNASIEAARAGEHGKGFTVVAENIRTLAKQSEDSSEEIKNILKDLSKNYDEIVVSMANTTNNVSIQNEKFEDTQKAFDVLEKDINTTLEKINNVESMVVNLDDDIKKMVDIISDLAAISEENSAGAEQTMASVEELNATFAQILEKAMNVDSSADVLMNEVNVFKTE